MDESVYIYKGGGNLGSIVGGSGARARVFLVLRECIWNLTAVSFVFPAFDNSSSLGCEGGLFPWFPPWVTGPLFLAENWKTELKPRLSFTSTFPRFPVFSPNPPAM